MLVAVAIVADAANATNVLESTGAANITNGAERAELLDASLLPGGGACCEKCDSEFHF